MYLTATYCNAFRCLKDVLIHLMYKYAIYEDNRVATVQLCLHHKVYQQN